MRWFEALSQLTQAKTPVVMVTLLSVRGHAPREAGAKMLVTADAVFGTIGGGNLEATAVNLARTGLSKINSQAALAPEIHTLRLTENAPAEYGVQCCGGEVQLLLETVVSAKPTVAIFGIGHVGLALAKVLSICPIELWLVDSRADMLAPERLTGIQGRAAFHLNHLPIPELAIQDLPAGSHLVVMTHDHAEDLALLDAALRRKDFGFIGLIGSRIKWANFRTKLLHQGFSSEQIARVTCPIGIPNVTGKSPEAIAIATAAQLMPLLEPHPDPIPNNSD